MRMLLTGNEMSRDNYVIPTVVLQRLLDAAAASYVKWTEDLSDADTQLPGKLSLQLADVIGIQSVLERLESLSSSSSSSSDVATEFSLQQHVTDTSRKTSKSSTGVVVNPARYKTELCRQFEEHGSCRYGDKCQFAHGAGELRTLVRHPKYKTEMCRTFHTTGFCPYGLRCHFIHNDDERRTAVAGLESSGLRLDAVSHAESPSPAEAFMVRQPHCRPIFRSSSSLSPSSVFTPEVDLEQRGRPILARSSTLPDRSTYQYINQHVAVPSVMS